MHCCYDAEKSRLKRRAGRTRTLEFGAKLSLLAMREAMENEQLAFLAATAPLFQFHVVLDPATNRCLSLPILTCVGKGQKVDFGSYQLTQNLVYCESLLREGSTTLAFGKSSLSLTHLCLESPLHPHPFL